MGPIAAAIVTAFAAAPLVLHLTQPSTPGSSSTAAPLGPGVEAGLGRKAPLDARLAALRAVVRAQPRRADGYTLLAAAELQAVRERGDAGAYARAQGAV